MAKVGVPEPPALWFGYAASELILPADHRGGALAHHAPRGVTRYIYASVRYALRPLFSALSSSGSRSWPQNTSPSST